ncbi:MAG TPA: hypothetical protein VHR15_01290 [Ktedonobacterales bacterium]|jgi:hypothetical protein|nr:hypothetical protein [Ktedonobacterales bacterium]
MSAQVVGIFIGIALGVIWITLGFGAVLLCVVLGIVGWVVAGVAQGTIHLGDVLQDLQGRRRSAEE